MFPLWWWRWKWESGPRSMSLTARRQHKKRHSNRTHDTRVAAFTLLSLSLSHQHSTTRHTASQRKLSPRHSHLHGFRSIKKEVGKPSSLKYCSHLISHKTNGCTDYNAHSFHCWSRGWYWRWLRAKFKVFSASSSNHHLIHSGKYWRKHLRLNRLQKFEFDCRKVLKVA